jgi:hypothetical protein
LYVTRPEILPRVLRDNPRTINRDGKVSRMKKRHSSEQIVGLLRQADSDFGKGMNLPSVCRRLHRRDAIPASEIRPYPPYCLQ